jgi:hypothetical protein
MLTTLYTPRQLWIRWSRPSPNFQRIQLPHRCQTIAIARILTTTNDKTGNTVTSTHCNEPWPTTPWNPLHHFSSYSCTVNLLKWKVWKFAVFVCLSACLPEIKGTIQKFILKIDTYIGNGWHGLCSVEWKDDCKWLFWKEVFLDYFKKYLRVCMELV